MSITLNNPTDAQLNAAFAEHVAGYKVDENGWLELPPQKMGGKEFQAFSEMPNYINDVNLLFPYLEKYPNFEIEYEDYNDQGASRKSVVVILYVPCDKGDGYNVAGTSRGKNHYVTVWDSLNIALPRAVLIALLKAKGCVINET